MKTVVLELPNFWATALFYDDRTGFDFGEEEPFDDFCQWAFDTYGTTEPVDMEEEGHFCKYHDASRFGVLACDVHKYTFIVNKEGV